MCYAAVPSWAETDLWYTGPLLAEPATVVPLGSAQLEIYGMQTLSNSIYNSSAIVQPTLSFAQNILLLEYTYGLARSIDLEWDIEYIYGTVQQQHGEGIGDTTLNLGYQVLSQQKNRHQPDIKLMVSETFPSGRYDHLSVQAHGINGTGQGSFFTTFSINTKYLIPVTNKQNLNVYLDMMYGLGSSVRVNGLSAYGGEATTQGRVQPGKLISFDLAFELLFTHHWGAVLEGYVSYQTKTPFHGFVDTSRANIQDRVHYIAPTRLNISRFGIGNDDSNLFSLCPGIEYNFSENAGVIIGDWFSISGKNTIKFLIPMIALSLSF